MSREERVLKILKREPVDYLPSQITFADRTRDKAIHKALRLPEDQTLDDYLENHLGISLTKADHPLFFRNDIEMMRELEGQGYCKIDVENNVVYDSWGMGIQIGSDGFFACFHPLRDKSTQEFVEKWMPPRIHEAMLSDTLEERVKKWTPPDPNQEFNYDWMKRDLESNKNGDTFWFASGYFGLYERAYGMVGIPEFLENTILNPGMIAELLEKITDYKIGIAENVAKLGFKAGHMGDDLGTQVGPFFSMDTFQDLLLPNYKRLWQVYKDAGMYVFLHSCGHVTEFLPELIDIGLDLLEPVQPCMDLKFLKKEFGKDLVFWGGIDTQELLPYASPAEVKKMAAETIRTLGAGGGHVIAPAQEVMKDVPLENVAALVETIISEREKVASM